MSHFFISYAHNDQTRVQELVSELQKRKFPVWVDDQLRVGDRWLSEIAKAIKGSAGFILMMTPSSALSEWVEAEVLFARNIKRPVLPVMLTDLSEEDFWYLAPFQHEDVRKKSTPSDAFFGKLARLLHVPISDGTDITEEEITIAKAVQTDIQKRLKQQESMTEYLKEHAKQGLLPVTYAEMANEFGIHLRSDAERYQFSNTLARISQIEHEHNRPLLSAVVVKAGDQYPGPGFYNLARRLKPEYAKLDDITIYAMEFKSIAEYWQQVG